MSELTPVSSDPSGSSKPERLGSHGDSHAETVERHPVEALASDLLARLRRGTRHADTQTEGGADPTPANRPSPSPSASIPEKDVANQELLGLMPVIERLENARRRQLEHPSGLASLGRERPEQLGDYVLRRQIGRGGMGIVYEAQQITLQRQVAVKVLPPTLLQDQKQVERFQREARLAASLHHTHIVPVFGVGEDDGYHYYVMQRIHGESLDRLIDRGESLSPEKVIRLGIQAADALHYAHTYGADDQGILHRDIKPANLMLDDEQKLWVMDFGVAKAIETLEATLATDPIGTLRYMAPEQAVGDADPRSDLFSLGLTLYELLAGRPAISDESLRSTWLKRQPRPIPAKLRSLRPKLSRDLETVIHKAIAADPDDRYATAKAFASDLQRILEGKAIAARRHSLVEQGYRWAKRRPLVAGLSATSLLLLVTVALTAAMGYVQVQQSLQQTIAAEENSRKTADVATEALDRLFLRFSDGEPSLSDQTSVERVGNLTSFTAPAISGETAELLQELLPYYDRLSRLQQKRSDGDQLPLSSISGRGAAAESVRQARFHLADLHFRLGNFEAAAENFQRVLEQLDEEDPGDVNENWLQRIELNHRIGRCYDLSGNREQSQRKYQQTLAQLQTMDPALPEVKFATARTLYLLAARLRPGHSSGSFPPIEAFQQRDTPRPRQPWRDVRRSLSVDEPKASRVSAEEREKLTRCYEIYQELMKSYPEDPKYRLHLAMTCREMCEGTLEIEVNDKVAQEDDNASERNIDDSAVSDDETSHWAQMSIEILQQLHEEDPQRTMICWELATTLTDFNVFTSISKRQTERGIRRVDRAIVILESLLLDRPGVTHYELALVHNHFKRSQLRWHLLDQLSNDIPPPPRRPDHHRRGTPPFHDDDFPPPKDFFPPEGGHRGGPPFSLGPNDHHRPDDMRERASLDSQVVSDLEQAIEGIEALIHDAPDGLGYQSWNALFHWRLAEAQLRKKQFEPAELAIARSLAIWEQLSQQNPDHPSILKGKEVALATIQHIQDRKQREEHDKTLN